MADFALWGMACETAFCPAGTFMTAYEQNRANTISNVLEGDAIAAAVQMLMEKQPAELDGRTEWTGTAAQLLAELVKVTAENIQKTPAWPKTPRGLSGQLRRIAPFLRKSGIVCDLDSRGTDRNRSRLIRIMIQPASAGNPPSAPSSPSEQQGFPDTPADDAVTTTVRHTAAEINDLDSADGLDDEISHLADLPEIGV